MHPWLPALGFISSTAGFLRQDLSEQPGIANGTRRRAMCRRPKSLRSIASTAGQIHRDLSKLFVLARGKRSVAKRPQAQRPRPTASTTARTREEPQEQ